MHKSWFYTAVVLIPLAMFIGFGWSSDWAESRSWISGAGAGCAAAAIIRFVYCLVNRRQGSSMPAPFYIGSGIAAGLYAGAVLLEISLFSHWTTLSTSSYLWSQILTLIGFVIITGTVELSGAYASRLERRDNRNWSKGRDTANRLITIRQKLQSLPDQPRLDHVQKQIRGLEDTLRYSDPNSVPALYEVEQLLLQKISLLEDQISLIAAALPDQREELANEALLLAQDLQRTALERNSQLLQAKTGST
ncbi:hypothetical protein [Paenibacillus sp. XY044]|uniref:hypothetical protein n=1 Tax=Paenibacillus sp. XY044 TaxID=2026089 RepID=UPI00117DE9B2|nr:hypothetical protein [Paenibacillus sp. XY044]